MSLKLQLNASWPCGLCPQQSIGICGLPAATTWTKPEMQQQTPTRRLHAQGSDSWASRSTTQAYTAVWRLYSGICPLPWRSAPSTIWCHGNTVKRAQLYQTGCSSWIPAHLADEVQAAMPS